MAGPTLSNKPLIDLPPPRMTGGLPLMDAMAKRHSTRAFRADDLPLQEVSNILWATAGHSRPYAGVGIHAEGCRASPGAHNWQEIDVHVASAHGLHLYDPAQHVLVKLLDRDIRSWTSDPTQPFVVDAPLNLIYVSDAERMHDAIEWDFGVFPWADTAVMVENVYLYCASEGLATVCRALFDRPALSEVMRLRPKQLVTFHQLVGYKKAMPAAGNAGCGLLSSALRMAPGAEQQWPDGLREVDGVPVMDTVGCAISEALTAIRQPPKPAAKRPS